MSSPDVAIISYAVDHDGVQTIQRLGLVLDDFVDVHRTVWKYLLREWNENGQVPGRQPLRVRFPDIRFVKTNERDVPVLVSQMKQRKKHNDFLRILQDTAGNITSFEAVDDLLPLLQRDLARLDIRDVTQQSHLIDLFHPDTSARLLQDLEQRATPEAQAEVVPTGLKSFDDTNGGLRKQQMVVVMGRTSSGKSWIDLLFVARAILAGRKVVLYPLEMTLTETAYRLYTIFTQSMFGRNNPRRVLKNLDLTQGRVEPRQAQRVFKLLEEQFEGRLHVADLAHVGDPYTTDKIEAEVEMLRPDMFWVDYLTLLRSSGHRNTEQDWQAVRQLSGAIKSIAMRYETIGGCSAQVNREAVRPGVLIPRLEHISFGDSIAHDADVVFSLRRKYVGEKEVLYYKVVKNRGGREIGKRTVRWDPNIGLFQEVPNTQAEDDEEDEEGE